VILLEEGEKTILVALTAPPRIVFQGIWTKADVDAAYRLMLKELPRHLQEIRQKMEAEK